MTLRRKTYGICLIIAILILAYTLFEEFYVGLLPCPLCILQRVCLFIVFLLLLLAFIHNAKGRIGRFIYPLLILIVSGSGFGVATRQVYLQNLPPDQVPACGPGLNLLIQTLPPGEVMRRVLEGSGECAMVQWKFLGLSMAGWSMIVFLLVMIVSIVLIVTSFRRSPSEISRPSSK